MKSTILLTTALFLASAPSPDAKTISELTAGFLSVDNDYGLMASEDTLGKGINAKHKSAYKQADRKNDIAEGDNSAERGIAFSQERAQKN
jgi:hypothetical protein